MRSHACALVVSVICNEPTRSNAPSTNKSPNLSTARPYYSSIVCLQAQDISSTVLFVVVWHGRDGENLPTGYNPVFFGWDGWDGWVGWMDGWMDGWVEVRVRILL